MIFDVIVREKEKVNEKDVYNVYRIRDIVLSSYLRYVQNSGRYIFSVIPLFKKNPLKMIEMMNKEKVNDDKNTVNESSKVDC